MKDLILKITNSNWGLKGPGYFDKAEWNIYSDGTIEEKVSYVLEEPKTNTYEINKDVLDEILNNIESSKLIDEKVMACDGEGWEFIQVNNGKVVWKRDMDYIYGLEPLETITKILKSLKK